MMNNLQGKDTVDGDECLDLAFRQPTLEDRTAPSPTMNGGHGHHPNNQDYSDQVLETGPFLPEPDRLLYRYNNDYYHTSHVHNPQVGLDGNPDPLTHDYSDYFRTTPNNHPSYVGNQSSGFTNDDYLTPSSEYKLYTPHDGYYFTGVNTSTTPGQNFSNGGNGISSNGFYSNSAVVPHQKSYQPSPAVLLHIDVMMKGIWRHMPFTDVILVSSFSDNNRISVHKTILASHSTFLRQILINNGYDVGDCSEDPILILPNFDSRHIKMLVQFFYSGEVSLSTQADIEPLREICTSLGVSSLMARLDELSLSLQCLPSYSHIGDNNGLNGHMNSHNTLNDVVPVDPPPPTPHHQQSVTNETSLTNTEIERAADNFDTTYLNNDDVQPTMTTLSQTKTVSTTTTTTSANEVQGRVKKKAFSCARCSSKFYTQESLRAHERMHDEKKPFSCEQCGKSISTRGHLAVHMRIHSGNLPMKNYFIYIAFLIPVNSMTTSSFKGPSIIDADF